MGCSGEDALPAQEKGPELGPLIPENARPSPVVVEVAVPSHTGPASLVVMGFHSDQMEGGWSREREAPKLYWFQDDVAVVQRQELMVPLAPDLVYVAALDLDLNRDINRGDIVSAPLVVSSLETSSLTLFLDRPFSPGPEPGGMDLAARPTTRGGEQRKVVVDTAFGLRFFPRGRIMVVGLPVGSTLAAREIERTGGHGRIEGSLGPRPDGSFPARVAPTFLWVSMPMELDWPVELDVLLPDGLDTYVVLDLDHNGYPSTGDMASLCACGMKRPAKEAAPTHFLLESVVPSNEQVSDKLMADVDPEDDWEEGSAGEEDPAGEEAPVGEGEPSGPLPTMDGVMNTIQQDERPSRTDAETQDASRDRG